MQKRRTFVRSLVGASAIGGISGIASGKHNERKIPHSPNLSDTEGWNTVLEQTGPDSPEKVAQNYKVLENKSAKQKLTNNTSLKAAPVTFFAGTFRFVGMNTEGDFSDVSISIPILGGAINIPIKYARGHAGGYLVGIPDSIEERGKEKFTSSLESVQNFTEISESFGGFPGGLSYNKKGYQMNLQGFEANWENKDKDGLVEDVSFEGVASFETIDEGRNFLVVGGMFPSENIVSDSGIIEYEVESWRSQIRKRMKQTKLP